MGVIDNLKIQLEPSSTQQHIDEDDGGYHVIVHKKHDDVTNHDVTHAQQEITRLSSQIESLKQELKMSRESGGTSGNVESGKKELEDELKQQSIKYEIKLK